MHLDTSSFLQQLEERRSTRTPLEALDDAVTTLVIIRNAMSMLASDHEGEQLPLPGQRELFARSYTYIAEAVETLREVHKELMKRKALE